MSYRDNINNIAYNQLTTVPHIPDAKLMVGYAELLHSIPVLLFTDYYAPYIQSNPSRIPLDYIAIENANPDLQGEKYNLDMFDTESFYLGSTFMGV